MKQVPRTSKGLAFGIIIFGLIVFIASIAASIESALFYARAKSVNGVITGISVKRYSGDTTDDYYIGAEVQYTVNGITRELFIPNYDHIYSRPREAAYMGRSVSISYDPRSPGHARSSKENHTPSVWFIIGLTIIAVGIVMLIQHLQYNRIWRDGYNVDARVVYVKFGGYHLIDPRERSIRQHLSSTDETFTERNLEKTDNVVCLEFADPISGEPREIELRGVKNENLPHIGDSYWICIDNKDMSRYIVMQ